MKKKIWKTCISALVCGVLLCGFAACGETGGESSSPKKIAKNGVDEQGCLYILSEDKTHYSVGYYETGAKEIVIPDTYQGLPVTEIEPYSFFSCPYLESVVIGNNVITIGDFCFRGVPNLKNVEMSDKITWVGNECFADAPLQFNEYENGRYLGNEKNPYVFLVGWSSGEKLMNIHPDTKMVAPRLSYDGDFITYGNGRYLGCDENPYMVLMDYVEGATTVSIHANTTMLTSAIFAFEYIEVEEGNAKYKAIDGNLYTKDGETLIRYARHDETSFVVPQGVKKIASKAFSRTPLTSIVFPNGLTSIGSEAFNECENLMNVTIPNTIENLGYQLFGWRIFNIQFTEYENGLYLGNEKNPHLILCAWKTWELTEMVIHPNTKLIANNASLSRASYTMENVDIPDSVRKIYSDIIGYSPLTESIEIGKNVVWMGVVRSPHASGRPMDTFAVDTDNLLYASQDGVLYNKNYTAVIHVPKELPETVTLPEGLKMLNGEQWQGIENVKIPASLERLENYDWLVETLDRVEVDENNAYYKSVDGCLYTKNGKFLLHAADNDTMYISKELEGIECVFGLEIIPNIPPITFVFVETVRYEGTKEEWNQIVGRENIEPFVTTIICSDGLIKGQEE